MNEQICQRCQQALFAQVNASLCDQCAERLFDKVKEYISENSYNSIDQVSEDTDVERKYITKWIQQGRLILSSPDAQEIREKILNFQRQASQLLEKEEPVKKETDTGGSRFHFLDPKKSR